MIEVSEEKFKEIMENLAGCAACMVSATVSNELEYREKHGKPQYSDDFVNEMTAMYMKNMAINAYIALKDDVYYESNEYFDDFSDCESLNFQPIDYLIEDENGEMVEAVTA